MIQNVWLWAGFLLVVCSLLAIDLGVLHKKNKSIGIKESLYTSLFYILAGLIFGFWIYYQMGQQRALEYLTGFLVEKSLSLDNIFVISVIFTSLSISPKYQHKVLFWGVLGAIVLRAIIISLGVTIVAKFSWVLYIFAFMLILVGIKIFFISGKKPGDSSGNEDGGQNNQLENNKIFKWLNKHLKIEKILSQERFFVRKVDPTTNKKVVFVTPLFLALIIIEVTDLVFAIDSVPAIFTITQDPYIVYTSNIFAILGMRALYFALGAVMDRFHYLKYSLAIVLIFIGSKMFIKDLLNLREFPPLISLLVTVGLIAGGCVYSFYKTSSSNKKY